MTASLLGRKLIIGVDRLDYSKGLTERFAAFEHFLETFPDNQGKVTFLQIAPLSRADVLAYSEIRAGARAERGPAQRPLRGGGLDAHPLSQPQLLARDHDGIPAGRAGRARDAGARWHESGREGIRRRAGPEGSRRADHLADGRRGARAHGRAAGESLRQARHGARAAERACTCRWKSGVQRHRQMLDAIRRNDIHHWYSEFCRDLDTAGVRPETRVSVRVRTPVGIAGLVAANGRALLQLAGFVVGADFSDRSLL